MKLAIKFLMLIFIFGIAGCGNQRESHNDENRLVNSFENESQELKQYVAEVVKDAREEKYQDALNKLALLSSRHILTKKQQYAVDTIMKQLLYDMEEKMFKDREKEKKPVE